MQLTRLSLLALFAFLIFPTELDAQTTERAKLTASDGTSTDNFGNTFTLAGDVALVGAPGADLPGAPDAGAAYVFERSGATWTETAKLTASSPAADENFGATIKMVGDVVVVGVPKTDLPGAPNAGAVYIFERNGATWTETAKLTAASPNAGANFGASLQFDGNSLFVGAPRQTGEAIDDNYLTFLIDKGAVFVFERISAVWTEVATLGIGFISSGFGWSIAMQEDRAAVTYTVEQVFPNITTELVAFYRRENGVWLRSGGASLGAGLGTFLALEDDLLVVRISDFTSGGLLHLYERSANSFSYLQSLSPPPQIPTGLTGGLGFPIIRNNQSLFVTASTHPFDYDFVLLEYSRNNNGPFAQEPFTNIQGIAQSPLQPSSLNLVGNDLWLGFSSVDVAGVSGAGEAVHLTQTAGVWSVADRRVASDPVPNHLLGHRIIVSDRFAAASTFGGVDDAVYVFDLDPHQEFCFGDGSSPPGCGTCPCGNDAPSGTIGGCLNTSQRSARLLAFGKSSLAEDSLTMELLGAKENSFAILLSGNNALPQVGPCPVGSGIQTAAVPMDGLRCVGSQLIRHGTRSTDSQGDATSPGWGGDFAPPGGLLSQLSQPSGATRHFQVFYRDLPSSGCGTGLNTTNAVSIQLRP